MELLNLLRAARWLTTSQVRRRLFASATPQAARRRLRLLVGGAYLRKRQESRMQEAVFALGRAGKRALEREGAAEIALETVPPKQREHMAGINDLRIAAELAGQVGFFFAAWELPAAGWKHPIIPDAVFRLGNQTFAAEYDCGTEGIQFFIRTKLPAYRRGFPGFRLAAVLIVADRAARMEALKHAINDAHGLFHFTTIEAVRECGITACFPEVLRRGNGFAAPSGVGSEACRKPGAPS